MGIVTTKRLSPENFGAYGVAMSVEGLRNQQGVTVQTANQGSATKLARVGEMVNKYPLGDARTYWDIFQCGRVANKWHGNKYRCVVLERHPYTSQTFVPMGVRSDNAYVVICAPDVGGKPDWTRVEMFVASGDVAVMYHPGTWHAPMVVVEDTIDFMVICSQNDVPADVCEEVFHDEGVMLELVV